MNGLLERKVMLKLLFYIVKQAPNLPTPIMPGEFHVAVAFDDMEAMQTIKVLYPTTDINAQKLGEVNVAEVLNKIEMAARDRQGTQQQPAPANVGVPAEVIAPPKTVGKKKNKEEFIQGLMLVADVFVTDKKDQEALKKIISRIKL